jgi:hypothetical protein
MDPHQKNNKNNKNKELHLMKTSFDGVQKGALGFMMRTEMVSSTWLKKVLEETTTSQPQPLQKPSGTLYYF